MARLDDFEGIVVIVERRSVKICGTYWRGPGVCMRDSTKAPANGRREPHDAHVEEAGSYTSRRL